MGQDTAPETVDQRLGTVGGVVAGIGNLTASARARWIDHAAVTITGLAFVAAGAGCVVAQIRRNRRAYGHWYPGGPAMDPQSRRILLAVLGIYLLLLALGLILAWVIE